MAKIIVSMTVTLEFDLTNRQPEDNEVSEAVFQLTEAALQETLSRRYADFFSIGDTNFTYVVER